MASTTAPHVLIVGAGPTGLLIARGLKAQNIPFDIFEARSAESGARDWSMALHWGRELLAEILPSVVLDRVEEAGTDLHLCEEGQAKQRFSSRSDGHDRVGYEDDWKLTKCFELSARAATHLPLVNAVTGEVIADVPVRDVRRVRKSKYVEVLREGIDVKFDHAVSGYELLEGKRVRIDFKNGHSATGDIVVGCDGSKSVIRSFLFNITPKNDLTTMPMLFLNFQATYPPDTALLLKSSHHPVLKLGIHPHRTQLMIITTLAVPDPKDPSGWVFQLYFSSWNETRGCASSEERIAYLKEMVSEGGWIDPWYSAAMQLDEKKVKIEPSRITYMADLQRFDNNEGRVTLAGDAAHTMPPHRGQGLNNAVLDAVDFVKAIKRVADASRKGEGMASNASEQMSTTTRAADPDSATAASSADPLSSPNLAASTRSVLAREIEAYDAQVWSRGKAEIEMSEKQAFMAHRYDEFMRSPLVTNGMHR